ncbi:PH domain-containing protein [Patulibacter americanus]|uniref:PH domain-containing protein n=1 Tax=Patulibacter americanus TaxID=588672 RepID=UPI0003B5ED88|nr:PH domain-containing protein [Patulibacter americanus]
MSPSPPGPGPVPARPDPPRAPAEHPTVPGAPSVAPRLPGRDEAPLPADDGRRQLSERAVPYWRIQLALYAVPAATIATVAAVLLDLSSALTAAVVAAAWVAALAVVVVVPPVRRGIWWYAIGEEEVDLREGLLVITRTVVPMVRVQHVDLHRGPISTRLGLAEIELHTAAGSVTIPALDRDEAERIRQQVSVLARVPDDL